MMKYDAQCIRHNYFRELLVHNSLMFICSFQKVKHICPPTSSESSQYISIAFGIQKVGCAYLFWLILF
jgi:hypothetical protein